MRGKAFLIHHQLLPLVLRIKKLTNRCSLLQVRKQSFQVLSYEFL